MKPPNNFKNFKLRILNYEFGIWNYELSVKPIMNFKLIILNRSEARIIQNS